MIEYRFEIIEHKFLSACEQDQIIELKQNYWKYSSASQKKWIEENVRDNDVHILLYDGDIPIAYLCISGISVDVGNTSMEALGIGNVCVKKEYTGKGIGKQCIYHANAYISEQGKIGILLCHDNLRGFYGKCGWTTVADSDEVLVTIAQRVYQHKIMVLNNDCKLFSSCKRIKIDRNF